MRYLVCEHRKRQDDKAVIHVNGKCWPQRDPGVVTPNTDTHWFGYYKTLGEAMDKARATGRKHVTKCHSCFRARDWPRRWA